MGNKIYKTGQHTAWAVRPHITLFMTALVVEVLPLYSWDRKTQQDFKFILL